jgi:hypothetical protein
MDRRGEIGEGEELIELAKLGRRIQQWLLFATCHWSGVASRLIGPGRRFRFGLGMHILGFCAVRGGCGGILRRGRAEGSRTGDDVEETADMGD